MKMRRPHIVPLSAQSVAILRELQPWTGTGRYLFPSVRTEARPLSDATMLNALRRMGYQKDEMSVHGFRSIASTLLNELGYNRDWIERQLAHGERNEVRAAQLCGVSAGAPKDDAGVGRLSRQTPHGQIRAGLTAVEKNAL